MIAECNELTREITWGVTRLGYVGHSVSINMMISAKNLTMETCVCICKYYCDHRNLRLLSRRQRQMCIRDSLRGAASHLGG